MQTNNVLVFGASGQLGQCIQEVERQEGSLGLNLMYLSEEDGDITDPQKIKGLFTTYSPHYVINCAAYTAVDKAEEEPEAAGRINVVGVSNLVDCCDVHHAVLIHTSTDFVFDGTQSFPLKEEDLTNPLGVYGQTKLEGELQITNKWAQHFIIRTSWLYSEFGHNFLKTMLQLSKERDQVSVVCDQVGTPTYGMDLAKFIWHILSSRSTAFGIYHFSNEGVASWYDFAYEILGDDPRVNLIPVNSEAYPTKAVRPKYSVLDKTKVKKTFSYAIPHWKESLMQCITAINQDNKTTPASARIEL